MKEFPSPFKSPNDTNEYRHIELDCGLRVLLIRCVLVYLVPIMPENHARKSLPQSRHPITQEASFPKKLLPQEASFLSFLPSLLTSSLTQTMPINYTHKLYPYHTVTQNNSERTLTLASLEAGRRMTFQTTMRIRMMTRRIRLRIRMRIRMTKRKTEMMMSPQPRQKIPRQTTKQKTRQTQ